MADSLAETMGLGIHANKFHPLALKNYQEFFDDISQQVPLNAMTEDDMKEFLSESEYADYESGKKSLYEWLNKCLLTNDESTLKVYPDRFPVFGVSGFKELLLKVCEKKKNQILLKKAKSDAEIRAYQDKQQKERERKKAIAEHNEFYKGLERSFEDMKTRLAGIKKPGFDDYPDWIKPYRPGLWCELSFPPLGWKSSDELATVLAQKALLDADLFRHVITKITHGAWHIPKVIYEVIAPQPSSHSKESNSLKGTPCLQWLMDTYILSTIEFRSGGGTVSDERYGWIWEMGINREYLGKAFSGPTFWECQPAFVTPVSLLAVLAGGNELPDVEIAMRDEPWTEFEVKGFPDEVILHDDFIRFIREMVKTTTLDKALLDRELCDEVTAGLIKSKLRQLEEPESPTAVQEIFIEPENKTGDNYTDVVNTLTQKMGYGDTEAKAAAKFAYENHPDGTVLEIIKMAVQFLEQ